MKKKNPPCCSDGVIIRYFRVGDYDAVIALWRRTEGVGLNESDTRRSIAAYLRRNPRLSFIAEKGGRVVGAVLCGHDGRRGYLHHLAVAKRYRKLGIGRQLVDASLTGLRALDIHKCNIFVFGSNAHGIGFWKRIGWNIRPDLRMMQVHLGNAKSPKPSCSC